MAGQLDAALKFIGHNRWMEAMTHGQDSKDLGGSRSTSLPTRTTPMKRMIRFLPEAALAVLKVRGYRLEVGTGQRKA